MLFVLQFLGFGLNAESFGFFNACLAYLLRFPFSLNLLFLVTIHVYVVLPLRISSRIVDINVVFDLFCN